MANKRSSKKHHLSCFPRRPRAANYPPPSPPPADSAPVKALKKKTGTRLWYRYPKDGTPINMELDKSAIIRRVGIPTRDLRILGPVFSQSSNILAREKAMVVNLEFIKAIVTADEVLVLDPLNIEVRTFIDQLMQQLPLKGEAGEAERELPFEFQVLEIALVVVCTYLDSSVSDLERTAYPVLDELAIKVSTKNLERVRSLKSNLTRLLARVQKVRDEIEHLLDDNEDMAHLYLTRKQTQYQHFEALMASATSNSIVAAAPNLSRLNSKHGSASIVSRYSDENDVEDLEMLLEAYFMQLDGTRNKILSVREYIDDTEDYVNIQLDNQRNELIQLQLILTIAAFAIAVDTLIVGALAMNLPNVLYNINGIFWPIVGSSTSGCFMIFVVILVYARWKKLIGP